MKHWFPVLASMLILFSGCATGIKGSQGVKSWLHCGGAKDAVPTQAYVRGTSTKSSHALTTFRKMKSPGNRISSATVDVGNAQTRGVKQVRYEEDSGGGASQAPILSSPQRVQAIEVVVPEPEEVRYAVPTNGQPRSSDLFVYAPTDWQGVTYEEILQTACENHPVISKAQSRIEALRGRYQQKGLPNNPMIGLSGSDMNQDGKLGRVGGMFGRTVVRNGKRQADQAVVSAEIEVAQQQLQIAKQRLATDVELEYGNVLVAQEQAEMARRLVTVASTAVEVSEKLFEAQEVARSAVLQSELELEKARVAVRRFENQHVAAKRKLAALIGQSALPTQNVAGCVSDLPGINDFETAYDELIQDSPAVAALFAEIERARRAVSRQRLETVSDLSWQTTLEYDTVEDNVVGGFQMTWQIPVLNKNQGAIYQAERAVLEAQHSVETKTLQLRQQLAAEYERYVDAQVQVEAYEKSILPKSARVLELLLKGYTVGESELLEVLVAQRTFFQSHVTYLENMRLLKRQNIRIRGMLLSDSLSDS